MNIVLYARENLIGSIDEPVHRVRIDDERRVDHIIKILKLREGDVLRCGILDGYCGSGEIVDLSRHSMVLNVTLTEPPPDPLPVVLLLALPRPLVLRRLLADIASFGVKEIHLLQTARVEKSYWQSPVLDQESIRQALLKGLEQAMDTRLPSIEMHVNTRDFFANTLPVLLEQVEQAIVADPRENRSGSVDWRVPTLLAIGPEGGFIDKEVGWFAEAGFRGLSLGPRILRVETAVSALLGVASASQRLR